MTKKIFKAVLLSSVVSLITCFSVITAVMYGYFDTLQKQQLASEIMIISKAVENEGSEYLSSLCSNDYRFTLIAADGTVRFDSAASPENMENHSDREEFKEALSSGRGESERVSKTFTEKTIYSALRLNDGSVLRISVSRATVFTLMLGILKPLAAVGILALALSALIASRMSKRIIKPLNELDLDNPLENKTYDELSPLLRRVNRLHSQVDSQLNELNRKTDELDQIVGNMSEGLVLLDTGSNVLSINRSAQAIFGADNSSVGSSFLTVDRSHSISAAIEDALKSGHTEIQTEHNGREYQLDISRIESNGSAVGAVLLAFDITERVFAERNRREFTANVSHELKTPLQSIMGSAELIENGLVKSEDIQSFAGRIHTESARLVTLIEDIIKLSQLDEGAEMPLESVDLYALAQETVSSLNYAATAANVNVTLAGEPVSIQGVRKLLSEMLFNLCDNAIKYNKAGGEMRINIRESEASAVITVSDTGLGIPAEHQSRIFERFYRVDKSHSKESGGTGLGLSIVKHAVQYHNGSIGLTSEPDKGSEFTIALPIG